RGRLRADVPKTSDASRGVLAGGGPTRRGEFASKRLLLRLQGTAPRRTWPAQRGGLSPWFCLARTLSRHRHGVVELPVLTRTSPFLPSALRPTAIGTRFPLLPLHRRGGCRGNDARRLLDDLQPQLACLPGPARTLGKLGRLAHGGMGSYIGLRG